MGGGRRKAFFNRAAANKNACFDIIFFFKYLLINNNKKKDSIEMTNLKEKERREGVYLSKFWFLSDTCPTVLRRESQLQIGSRRGTMHCKYALVVF